MKVKAKILDGRLGTEFPLPKYATAGSAGIDLRAMHHEPVMTIMPNECVKIPSGLAIHLCDPNYAAVIIPRSGLGTKGLVLGNLVGLIDSDYQGEMSITAWNRSDRPMELKAGERYAQLVVVPVVQANLEFVEEFDEETDRGAGGFGSTGTE